MFLRSYLQSTKVSLEKIQKNYLLSNNKCMIQIQELENQGLSFYNSDVKNEAFDIMRFDIVDNFTYNQPNSSEMLPSSSSDSQNENENNNNNNRIQKKTIQKRAQKLKLKFNINEKAKISLFQEITLPTDIAYIFGDEIIELDYNLNSFDCKSLDLNQYSRFKKVRMVEKRPDLMSFELNFEQGSKQMYQFQFAVDRFLQSNIRELHEFGLSLNRYQYLSLCCDQKMQYYHKDMKDQINCTAMIEKQGIYVNNSYDWLKMNTNQYDFYTYSFTKLNQQSMMFQNDKLGISQSLIALLGGDFDTISNLAIRKGGIHFLNSRSRLQELHDKIVYTNLYNGEQREYEVQLITFDQIIVPCKATIMYYQFPLCTDEGCTFMQKYQLQKIHWMKFYATCKLIKYEISPSMILQIMEVRKKLSSEQKILYEQYFDDFSYTTESEIFLEKYYENEKKQLLKQQEQKKTCGISII